MRHRFVHDVGHLPNHTFGPDSILWWGTFAFVAMEAMAFLLGITSYFYLMREVPSWPPGTIHPPELAFGSAFSAVMLASIVPNLWTKKAAQGQHLRGSLLGMAVLLALGIVLLVLRGFEFTTLNVRWDTNAYGSIIWVLLGLHTAHLATDVADTAVLLAVMLRGHVEPRRFTDVSENSDYWYFVVAAWLPIFVVVYLVPRLQ
jgi:cytochrome c oxidase subunit III